MKPATSRKSRADYGIDAPYFAPIPIFVVAAEIVLAWFTHAIGPIISAAFVAWVFFYCWHTTRRGKIVAWKRILADLNLRGDERILDIGCGRGAVLLNAAKHLTTGRAVGVDVWRKQDQSGNAADATQANAIAEGVSDRVTLVTADARSLPFRDATFDIILSSLAIHNISGTTERRRAIDEALRVLKPGGRVLIADLRGTRDYARRLHELNMSDVKRKNLGWRMWWGGPWVATRLVTGTKAQPS